MRKLLTSQLKLRPSLQSIMGATLIFLFIFKVFSRIPKVIFSLFLRYCCELSHEIAGFDAGRPAPSITFWQIRFWHEPPPPDDPAAYTPDVRVASSHSLQLVRDLVIITTPNGAVALLARPTSSS